MLKNNDEIQCEQSEWKTIIIMIQWGKDEKEKEKALKCMSLDIVYKMVGSWEHMQNAQQ